jgi:hypothetical protein
MGLKVKVITGNDPTILEERLQRFLDSLSEDVMVTELQFTVSAGPNQAIYAALVAYKQVEPWVDGAGDGT